MLCWDTVTTQRSPWSSCSLLLWFSAESTAVSALVSSLGWVGIGVAGGSCPCWEWGSEVGICVGVCCVGVGCVLCDGVCWFGVVVGRGLVLWLLAPFGIEWFDRLDAVHCGTPFCGVLSHSGPVGGADVCPFEGCLQC
jgi:hypothetical protein